MKLRNAALRVVVCAGLALGATAPLGVAASPPVADPPARPGRIVVRFAPGALGRVERAEREADGGVLRTGDAALDARADRWGVTASRPVFDAPANTRLARASGLHAFRVLTIRADADPVQAARDFAGDPRILSAEPDWIATPDAAPNDPWYAANWGHHNTGQLPSWNTSTNSFTGPPVGTPGFDAGAETAWDSPAGWGVASTVIALIDADGVDLQHADLRLVAGWDFTGNDPNPDDPCTSPGIGCGHGTKCAGLIAAIADDGFGTAGVAGGCSILPFRAAATSEVAAALAAAADSGAAVANLSFTWYGVTSNAVVAAAAAYAAAHDVLILSSSGNRNDNSVMWMPQVLPEILAVGSASPCGTRKRSSSIPSELRPDVQPDPAGASCDNERNWGSSWGGTVQDAANALDFLAPVILPAPEVGGGFEPFFSGTSASCAYASGVAALLRSVHPEWNAGQVRDRLAATTRDIVDAESAPGWDVRTGYGLLDAGAAVGLPVLSPDLEPLAPPGWAAALVPRDAPDAAPGAVPDPKHLAGDDTTWVNAAWTNAGTGPAGPCTTRVRVDGVDMLAFAAGPLAAGTSQEELNAACVVPGGRHTLELVLDAADQLGEPDETDNVLAIPRVWEPAPLPPDVVVERAPPPDPWAGAGSPGGGPWRNRDGVRVASLPGTEVFALAVHPADSTEDRELGVFVPSAGPTDGFADGTELAISARGAGLLDFALLSTRGAGPVVADAGVAAGAGTRAAPSRVEWRPGTPAIPGDTLPIELPARAMIAAGELEIAPADSGSFAFELGTADPSAPLTLALFLPGSGWRTLADTVATASTADDAHGPSAAVLVLDLPAGFHPFVVFRDPVHGTGAASGSLRIRPTPPDLTPVTLPGGHAPLVPAIQLFGDGCEAWPAPLELPANVITRFRYVWRNLGPPASLPQWTAVGLDGKVATFADPDVPAEAEFCRTGALGVVRGGRHTLTLALDVGNANDQIFRDDDLYGEQWVWGPDPLAEGVAVTAPPPPAPTGGHAGITVPPAFPNVDGFRTPAATDSGDGGRLVLAVVLPGDGADVDAELHDPSATPKSGFEDASRRAVSATPGAAAELVLVDADPGRGGAPGVRDLAILAVAGDSGYLVESTASVPLPLAPGVATPPDSLPSGRVARVLEAAMPSVAGPATLRLRPLSGTADLDLAVFALGGGGHYGRADAAVADAAGSGLPEDLVLDLPPGTALAIVIFKHSAADAPATATFELFLGDTTATSSPILASAPGRTGLRRVAPNPFAMGSTVEVELAHAQDAEVSVFDAAGRRIRRLWAGPHAAGRHALRWDGTDDAGRPVSSGVYFVRFRDGTVDEVRKITRLR